MIFASFGSNEYYIELAEKTFVKFKNLYPTAQKQIFTINDIPNKYIQFSQEEPRGFGYWWWLSFLYKKLSSETKENEIIIWSDARSGFTDSKIRQLVRNIKKIQWLNIFLNDTKKDMCVWQMENHLEQEWTTLDMLNHFGYNLKSDEATTGQFTNHFLTFRNNHKTKLFFEDFYNFSIDNKNLWLPKEYNLVNHPNFVEPRWLQSLLSLMIKKNDKELNFMKIGNKDIYKFGSLHPQIYKHDSKYPYLKK